MAQIELTDYPKRPFIQYRLDGEDNEYIVYQTPRDGGVSVLNSVGAEVFLLSDGYHTVQDIVKKICEDYDVPGESQVQKDVLSMLAYLQKNGVILILKD